MAYWTVTWFEHFCCYTRYVTEIDINGRLNLYIDVQMNLYILSATEKMKITSILISRLTEIRTKKIYIYKW